MFDTSLDALFKSEAGNIALGSGDGTVDCWRSDGWYGEAWRDSFGALLEHGLTFVKGTWSREQILLAFCRGKSYQVVLCVHPRLPSHRYNMHDLLIHIETGQELIDCIGQ